MADETVVQILCRTQGIGIAIAQAVAAKMDPKQSQRVVDLAAANATAEEILSATKYTEPEEITQESDDE
jgi:ribosomal protein S13